MMIPLTTSWVTPGVLGFIFTLEQIPLFSPQRWRCPPLPLPPPVFLWRPFQRNVPVCQIMSNARHAQFYLFFWEGIHGDGNVVWWWW
jgi:hypothetical protein